MKSLINFITEAENRVKATKQWMEEKYEEFNKLYFDNSLPKKIILEVQKPGRNDSWLGCQGEKIRFYFAHDHMENGMYIMYRKAKGMHGVKRGRGWTWESTVDESTRVKSIEELNPYIYISPIYDFDPEELEDTMIHEMIHLWTYKDGLAPLQAHGKEFKKKCKEIRELAKSKHGKNYHLTTYATDHSKYELNDEEKKKKEQEIIQYSKKAGGTYLVYFRLDDSIKTSNKNNQTERFFFVSKNMLPQLIRDVTGFHKRNASSKGKIEEMLISDQIYLDMCNEYGKFKTVRTYRYWDVENYPKLRDMMKGVKMENVLKESLEDYVEDFLNEDKKPYVKPAMTLIEIPADTNLSDINLEDIINAAIKDESDEKEGSAETDKNLMTP